MSVPLLTALLAQAQVASWTGYVDSRTTGAVTQFDGAPALTELVEGNAQVRLSPHDLVRFVSDLSLFWQGGWWVHGDVELPENYRPTFVASELYADLPLHENFRIVVGKKRLVWGPGMAFNPTDVLNPPKDPTDPASQRAGAWLAELEWAWERLAISLVAAGKVTRAYSGLPTAMIVDPSDDSAHWAAVARLYLLVADVDVNATYAFTHLYNDSFEYKSRVGLSASRMFGDLEVHGEVLLYTGSARLTADTQCIANPAICYLANRPLVAARELNATYVNAQALAGARYQFDDGAIVQAEYYFNGEGHELESFRDLATLAVRYPRQAQAALSGAADPGTPQKFALTALRRHYLVAQVSVPRLFDDWTVGGAVILGLDDLSALIVPQVQWMPLEWLQLTASAYLPIAGLEAEGVVVDGRHYGQFTLSPFLSRFMLQARAYF